MPHLPQKGRINTFSSHTCHGRGHSTAWFPMHHRASTELGKPGPDSCTTSTEWAESHWNAIFSESEMEWLSSCDTASTWDGVEWLSNHDTASSGDMAGHLPCYNTAFTKNGAEWLSSCNTPPTWNGTERLFCYNARSSGNGAEHIDETQGPHNGYAGSVNGPVHHALWQIYETMSILDPG